jgi:hypothetical protein
MELTARRPSGSPRLYSEAARSNLEPVTGGKTMPENPLMKFDARPDFEGLGQFSAHGCALGNHECCFFLPAREVAKIWVLVKAVVPAENPVALNWRFSCELKADNALLIAEEIFHSGYTEWDWGNGPENTLIGEITRLKVNRGDVGTAAISTVRFYVTPSALLRSADIISEKNGTVVVQTVVREGPICSASPGVTLRFHSVYRLSVDGKLESGIECELVESAQMQDFNFVVSLLQDALVVASLAERRILLLTGRTISYANATTTTFYRRDFAAPSEEETDIDATLISLQHIEQFMNKTVPKFGASSHSAALKQAIYFALHCQTKGIGDSFVMLFAGIETLVNAFEPVNNVEPPVPKKEWQTLTDSISRSLETHQSFRALPRNTQAWVLNNVKASNQVSFPDRFKKMCVSKKIDLSDLWPMVGAKSGLYTVRNRIVHGRIFSSDQEWFRVISAKFHLLWTLERSILAILEWPVEQSRISNKSLAGMTLYRDWRADQAYFASSE